MIPTHENRMISAHYSRMGHQECDRIHMGTLEILERTGVDVHDEKARQILVAGGASADGIRIRIPETMVTRALDLAPRRLTLYDRNQKPAIRAWGHNTYYGGGSDCLTVLDHRSGNAATRCSTMWSLRPRVMDSLPEIDFVMSLFLPKDVDQRIYDRYQMEVMLNHTTKPIVFVSPDFQGCVAAVEMCEAVAGGPTPSGDIRSPPVTST
jgi:trimethylamine--corrinoid protein Co-methyltransferase